MKLIYEQLPTYRKWWINIIIIASLLGLVFPWLWIILPGWRRLLLLLLSPPNCFWCVILIKKNAQNVLLFQRCISLGLQPCCGCTPRANYPARSTRPKQKGTGETCLKRIGVSKNNWMVQRINSRRFKHSICVPNQHCLRIQLSYSKPQYQIHHEMWGLSGAGPYLDIRDIWYGMILITVLYRIFLIKEKKICNFILINHSVVWLN